MSAPPVAAVDAMPERPGGGSQRLSLDPAAERQGATLRLGAAVVTALAALWLVLLSPPLRAYWCVLAGGLASVMWVVMWARARRRVAAAGEYFVEWDQERLTIAEGREPRRVPWGAVGRVRADEERLVVVVEREGVGDITLEPRYGGLGLHELAAALRSAKPSRAPLGAVETNEGLETDSRVQGGVDVPTIPGAAAPGRESGEP